VNDYSILNFQEEALTQPADDIVALLLEQVHSMSR
jgi:hypothetical protein